MLGHCEAKAKVSRIERGHHPFTVMVWWEVSCNGPTLIHFCASGIKIITNIYEETVLESVY